MKHNPALSALLRLHAELGGKIQQNRQEAVRLRQAMKHVEAVLRLLEPGYDVRPIAVRRRKPNQWFKRGTVLRHALDVLRQAEEPLSSGDISRRLLAQRGVPEPTSDQVRAMVGAVHRSLISYEGKTVNAHRDGHPVRWSLKT